MTTIYPAGNNIEIFNIWNWSDFMHEELKMLFFYFFFCVSQHHFEQIIFEFIYFLYEVDIQIINMWKLIINIFLAAAAILLGFWIFIRVRLGVCNPNQVWREFSLCPLIFFKFVHAIIFDYVMIILIFIIREARTGERNITNGNKTHQML